jgi:hypothetical protein
MQGSLVINALEMPCLQCRPHREEMIFDRDRGSGERQYLRIL